MDPGEFYLPHFFGEPSSDPLPHLSLPNGLSLSYGEILLLGDFYEVVGEWEADPINKKISHTSPLGVALIGKRKGDKVEVEAPAGKVVYEILAIE